MEHLYYELDESVFDLSLESRRLQLLLLISLASVSEALLTVVDLVVAHLHDQLYVVIHDHLQEVGSCVLLRRTCSDHKLLGQA